MRIVLRRAAEIGGASIHRLLGAFFKIVDPHAEMDKAVVALVKTRHLVVVFQKRNIDGAVGNVTADTGLADDLHAEGFLKKLCRLFGVRNGQCYVTEPSSHGSLR